MGLTNYREICRELKRRGYEVRESNAHHGVYKDGRRVFSIPKSLKQTEPRAWRNWITDFKKITGEDLRRSA